MCWTGWLSSWGAVGFRGPGSNLTRPCVMWGPCSEVHPHFCPHYGSARSSHPSPCRGGGKPRCLTLLALLRELAYHPPPARSPYTHWALPGVGAEVSFPCSVGKDTKTLEGLNDMPRASAWFGLGLHLQRQSLIPADPTCQCREGCSPCVPAEPVRLTGVQTPGSGDAALSYLRAISEQATALPGPQLPAQERGHFHPHSAGLEKCVATDCALRYKWAWGT